MSDFVIRSSGSRNRYMSKVCLRFMIRKIICLALLLFLSGCATSAKYKALLDTWLGSSEDALITSWGPPQSVYTMSNGKKCIEYNRETNMQMGGYTYTTPQTTYYNGTVGNAFYSGTATQYVTQQAPVYNVPLWCKTSFIVDSCGAVESWRYEGNHCVSRYTPKKKPITSKGEIRNHTSTPQDKFADRMAKLIRNNPTVFGEATPGADSTDNSFERKYWFKDNAGIKHHFSKQKELDLLFGIFPDAKSKYDFDDNAIKISVTP